MLEEFLTNEITIGFQKLNYKTKKYVENFRSGNQSIDNYFQRSAIDDSDTVTYIFIDEKKDKTIACVSLSCSKIDMQGINGIKFSRPAFEIKYFATNEEYHSLPYKEGDTCTLSEKVMMTFITYLFGTCRPKIGASFVILYSVKRAVHFYQKCNFDNFETYMLRSEDDYTADCVPMYMNLIPEI